MTREAQFKKDTELIFAARFCCDVKMKTFAANAGAYGLRKKRAAVSRAIAALTVRGIGLRMLARQSEPRDGQASDLFYARAKKLDASVSLSEFSD
jgi:hypothetical protein